MLKNTLHTKILFWFKKKKKILFKKSYDVIEVKWRHMTTYDVIWRHMTSLTSNDVIWRHLDNLSDSTVCEFYTFSILKYCWLFVLIFLQQVLSLVKIHPEIRLFFFQKIFFWLFSFIKIYFRIKCWNYWTNLN